MDSREKRMRVRPLLEETDVDGRVYIIEDEAGWLRKRRRLRETIDHFLGEAPDLPFPVTRYRVYDEVQKEGYRQLLIGYDVAPDEEVKAYVLHPDDDRGCRGAAVLCLHSTTEGAKQTVIGIGAAPGRDYGPLLAREGFIVMAPDHVCAGERQVEGMRPYDTAPFYARHPRWSATGKAIWGGQRALDVLLQIEGVDPDRIGALGHSLGGYSSIFLAAFDARVQAVVSSCGLTTWQDNEKKLEFARDHWYVHFPMLREPFLRDEIPFDMHEFAALVAPRPFLNISGMADTMYSPTNDNMPEVGYQLSELYRVLGHSERFGNFLMGDGHAVPPYSRSVTVSWLKHWLCMEESEKHLGETTTGT